MLHLSALLTDRGFSAQAAAAAISVVGFAVLIARVGTGYLLDRFFAPRLAAFFFCGAAVGIGMLTLGSTGKLALGAAFDWTHAYTVPLAGFFVAMVMAVWLMTRLGPYRYAATEAHEEHSDVPLQAGSLG